MFYVILLSVSEILSSVYKILSRVVVAEKKIIKVPL